MAVIAPTRTVYFAAVDMDCDGPSTSIFEIQVPINRAFNATDHMPRELWMEVFDGCNYDAHDELWPMSESEVATIIANANTWSEHPPRFFDHGKYRHMSVKGNWFRNY